MAKEPIFVAGTSWSYSNTNYIIAGIIIEKVLNKSPYDAIHDLILEPNQLSHTFNFGEPGAEMFAHPWSMSMTGTSATDMTTTPFLNNLFSLANTAGSLLTTAEDNVLFWHKLVSGQMINAQSWKEMTTMTNIGSSTEYGLGIFRYTRKINGRTAYSHGGTFFGYINENIVDTTSGVTVAVLTNQDSVNNNGLLNLVVKALHKVTLNMPATSLRESIYNTNNISIYPNPATNNIQLQIDNQQEVASVRLLDFTGNEISIPIPENNILNVSNVPAGLYVLNIIDNSGMLVYTQKIQVIH